MTVQELIDALSEYDPYLQVGLIDGEDLGYGNQISCVYEDVIDKDTEKEQAIVYIGSGQLL